MKNFPDVSEEHTRRNMAKRNLLEQQLTFHFQIQYRLSNLCSRKAISSTAFLATVSKLHRNSEDIPQYRQKKFKHVPVLMPRPIKYFHHEV
jgi:hypothetical protein